MADLREGSEEEVRGEERGKDAEKTKGAGDGQKCLGGDSSTQNSVPIPSTIRTTPTMATKNANLIWSHHKQQTGRCVHIEEITHYYTQFLLRDGTR
ncbi:hypothetical protein EYF80_015947 [Liparis tanakae]|uniref:Uncharacterized protein n=1 Tax=Liparis tanakae TaxID=230148 RepID=A0A4Z2I7W0_9TELE|nr:hypothetical protein EYF80_015947 [Liparis tanakae]